MVLTFAAFRSVVPVPEMERLAASIVGPVNVTTPAVLSAKEMSPIAPLTVPMLPPKPMLPVPLLTERFSTVALLLSIVELKVIGLLVDVKVSFAASSAGPV